MNFRSILLILIVITIILLLVYFFIIKKFNDFIKDHRRKMDQFIYKVHEKDHLKEADDINDKE